MLRSRIAPALIGFLLVLALGAGSIQAKPEDPATYIQALGQKVISVINSSHNEEERMQRFQEMFAENFEVETIARFVVGRYWRQATEQQRQDYLDAFRDYVLATYGRQFATYSGEQFEVLEQRQLSDRDTLVAGRIIRPNEPPLGVSFRVRDMGDHYSIVDVAVEGVSLLITKRSEFSSIVSREGMEGLIDRLRRQAGAA